MSLWPAVIAASALVYSWKLFGFLVPNRFASHPRIKELATLLTVSLLAALVGIQSFGGSNGISFDERIPALVFAGVLFKFKVPYVVVVFSAAAVAALLRLLL